jgi:hypothetical protein
LLTGFLVATLVIGAVLIPATLRKLEEPWQASSLGEKSKGEAGTETQRGKLVVARC